MTTLSSARATFRRITGRVAAHEPALDALDQHAAEARGVVEAGRHTQLIAAARRAPQVLRGEQLVDQVVEVLTPVYFLDDDQLANDQHLREFIRADARFLVERLDQLGLQLVRTAAR